MIKELMLCGLLTLSPVKMANNDIKQPKPRMALHEELTWDEYQRTLENRWNVVENENPDYFEASSSISFFGYVGDNLMPEIREVTLSLYSGIYYYIEENLCRISLSFYSDIDGSIYDLYVNNSEIDSNWFYYELSYLIDLYSYDNDMGIEMRFLNDTLYGGFYYNDDFNEYQTNSTSIQIAFNTTSIVDFSDVLQHTTYYWQQQFNALENEYDNLQDAYNNLVNNTIILEQDYERLQADFEELTTQYNELLRDYNTLELSNIELVQQIQDLNSEIALLNDYIITLEMQIDGVNDNNVFAWFGDVFDTIARVLNIEILPNIKLAYLFAIPIIAAAIFFVIKVTNA